MSNDVLYLVAQYMKTTAKAWFQYRVDAFMRSLAVFLREATGIIVIYLTLQKFDNLNGWNLYEMMFLYSFLFLTYGILIIFFTGLRDFAETVRKGDFDRFLLRPRGPLFQIIFVNADWFAAVGHGTLGILLFVVTANKIGVEWSVSTIYFFIFAIIGGVLIQGAIFLFLATLSFYLIETGSLKELMYYNVKKFAGYPISIYHKIIQVCMIYVVPFAFVNYFPAQFILRKGDSGNYPIAYLYLAPVVGLVAYFIAYLFWRYSIRFYKSAGN